MTEHNLTDSRLAAFEKFLYMDERSQQTVKKYMRDVKNFKKWLGEKPVNKEQTALWKQYLSSRGYSPATINSMISALNRLTGFLGWDECRVKHLKIQHRFFRCEEKELTKAEYTRLVETARLLGKERLALICETICATGIRVSEVKYITVEAARTGRTEISLKGKVRTILLPNKLCRKLLKYAKKQKSAFGEIFLTKSGKSISRRQIWAEMKSICKQANVAATKVFPHNLRHLFAKTFYNSSRDIAKLADVLGHSSINTTRIYLISTGTEHAAQLERLGLVV